MKLSVATVALCMMIAVPAHAQFTYRAPGLLKPSQSGAGQKNRKVYAPRMRFPLALKPKERAYINSQVWGVGGRSGPNGYEKSSRNYRMPWSDN